MKKYIYTNDIGVGKLLCVVTEEDGSLDCTLWSDHGDFCGQAQMTQEELKKFLEHYNAHEVK